MTHSYILVHLYLYIYILYMMVSICIYVLFNKCRMYIQNSYFFRSYFTKKNGHQNIGAERPRMCQGKFGRVRSIAVDFANSQVFWMRSLGMFMGLGWRWFSPAKRFELSMIWNQDPYSPTRIHWRSQFFCFGGGKLLAGLFKTVRASNAGYLAY